MSTTIQPTETKAEKKNRLQRERRQAARIARAAAQDAQEAAEAQAAPGAPAAEEPAGLAARAMLARQSVSWWEGRYMDKRTSAEVKAGAKAAADAGYWWTRLLPASALANVKARVNAARTIHHNMTLPWSDAGVRILPAAMYFEYTTAMRAAREEFLAEVERFLAEYPAHVAAAPARLGSLMDQNPFPTAEELRGKFNLTVDILPLPTAADFRVALGDTEVAAIRADIEKRGQETLQAAMADLWTQLHGAVTKIAERLGDPDAAFRDSLIGNLAKLCDLLPKMNVTSDPNLEAARQEVLAKLAGRDAATLRTDKPARAEAAAQAARIAAGMAAFFKPAAVGE